MPNNARKRGAKKVLPPEVAVGDQDNLSSIAAEIIAPTEVSIREVRARIEEAFNGFGTEAFPGTIIPTGKKNNSAEASAFVIADALSKLATERLKKAHEAAEKAGVFGDPADYVQGDTVMVFNDPNYSINVKMGKPSKTINRELVEATAREYLGAKADEFLDKCFKDRKPTQQIIVSVK
jgi:hypothetical protein